MGEIIGREPRRLTRRSQREAEATEAQEIQQDMADARRKARRAVLALAVGDHINEHIVRADRRRQTLSRHVGEQVALILAETQITAIQKAHQQLDGLYDPLGL